MELTGKGILSLRKGEIIDSTERMLDYGYRKITFAHQSSATGGDDHIPLDSLNYPTGYEASIGPNPSAQLLLSMNLREFCSNLTLHSTARGQLIPDISYTCTNTKIHLNGFLTQPNEIFYGIISHVTRPNTVFVDAVPINISRPLAAGQTTFAIGEPFHVNAFENDSSGAVKVYVDGILVYRNTNNSDTTLDRDYYEVPSTEGLGIAIEFNSVSNVAREVTVVSNYAYIDRPNYSLLNRFDTLAAQLESIAAQTGSTIDLSQFPNTFDIKAFGDRMLNAEDAQRLFDPTALSDAEATKLGLKQYAITVTGLDWVTARAVTVPYQMQDGTWRLKFNISGTKTPNTDSLTLTLSGVLFSTVANHQAITGYCGDEPLEISRTQSGSGDILLRAYNGVVGAGDNWSASGDVELDAKPSWAV